jgi:signal recognition particle subunit SRP54
MFESLSEKLQAVFDRLGRKGKLTEEDVEAALREVRVALLEADVSLKVVRQFVAAVKEKAVGQEVLQSLTPAQTVVKIVHDQLVELLGASPPRLTVSSKPPTVVMLVGLQGAGKTTLAAKLALQVRKMNHTPLLVAADPYRPAAVDQLQTLGKQIEVPVYHEPGKKPPELAQAAVKYANQHQLDFVIVDTAGRLQIAEDLMRELEAMREKVDPDEILLVADAMTGQEAVHVAEGFLQRVPLTGVVLTKMDGDARGGAALSVKDVVGKPILFVGTGEKLEDFEPFHPDRMASRILGMGDVLTLIEKAEATFDQEEMEKTEQKLRKGQLTLEDFLDQMRQVRRMGPLQNVLAMLPGVPKEIKNAEIDDREINRIEAIICSMTPAERRDPSLINGSRRVRIANGSGVTPADVNGLLKQFKMVQQMMKSAGKGKMPKMPAMGELPELN